MFLNVAVQYIFRKCFAKN